MRQRRRQSGEGQVGCMIGLIVMLIAIFIAYKMIPIKVKAAEIRQTVMDESKSAGTHNDERITKAILAQAEKQGLPITEDNIQINRQSNQITIDVEYVVPVAFPGYTHQWHFHHHAENPIF